MIKLLLTEKELKLIRDLAYRDSYINSERGNYDEPINKLYAKLRRAGGNK